tara:strand:+ start:4290 stop:4712 length:423 start_codon:yes stop_codon:yes gene_type:complete
LIRVGRGRNAITLEGLEADQIEAELNAQVGDILDVLKEQAVEIRKNAQATWPVKTGKSKDGFYEITTIIDDGQRLEVSILNKEPYVPYIKSTKVGTELDVVRNRSPLGEMRKAANKARKDIALMLKAVLEDKLKKMFGGS